jgi:hypothetical protein
MPTATTATLLLVRLTGLVQLATGLLFWTGTALALLPLHLLAGLVLVLALWALAALGGRAGGGAGLPVLAALWGVLVVVLGLTQSRLLPGDAHWVIQALHLVVGLIAIGLAQRLAARGRPRVPGGTPARAAFGGGAAPRSG